MSSFLIRFSNNNYKLILKINILFLTDIAKMELINLQSLHNLKKIKKRNKK